MSAIPNSPHMCWLFKMPNTLHEILRVVFCLPAWMLQGLWGALLFQTLMLLVVSAPVSWPYHPYPKHGLWTWKRGGVRPCCLQPASVWPYVTLHPNSPDHEQALYLLWVLGMPHAIPPAVCYAACSVSQSVQATCVARVWSCRCCGCGPSSGCSLCQPPSVLSPPSAAASTWTRSCTFHS